VLGSVGEIASLFHVGQENSRMTTPADATYDLSIVIPLYNEEAVFVDLWLRLAKVMDAMPLSAEVVLVDDGSSDGTRELAAMACREDPRFRLVALSRNFGHQLAVSAGLQHAGGRAVAILDGDLQDPPEMLPEFHRKLSEGYDVVYAVRRRRKEWWPKRLAYWLFYRLLRSLASIDIPLDSGDFCILSRRVVQQMNQLPERHRFVRGLRSWLGFRQIGLEYDRAARGAGESKYTLRKLLRLACDGFFTFSDAPLRLATWLGLIVTFAALVVGVCAMLWNGSLAPALAAGMFFLGGVQLICLGILGEYIGRIHNEVKGRPAFVVEELVGFEHERADSAARSASEDVLAGASSYQPG
jgi:dolichol-phosphate mannosyltransferase